MKVFIPDTFSRLFLSLQIIIFAWFIANALIFNFSPINDYSLYWKTSANISENYWRGGALVFLYWPLSFIGFNSIQSAFMLNGTCFFIYTGVIFYFLKLVNPKLKYLFLIPVFTVDLWWSSYGLLISSELPHVTLLSLGILLFHRHHFDNKWFYFISAIIVTAAGMTIRLNTFACFAVFVACFISYLIISRNNKFNKLAFGFLIIIVLVFASESALRSSSKKQDNIKVFNRLSLFAGFLNASFGPACGHIQPKFHTQKARESLERSIIEIVYADITSTSLRKKALLIACKFERWINLSSFAYFYVYSHQKGGIRQAMDAIDLYSTSNKSIPALDFYCLFMTYVEKVSILISKIALIFLALIPLTPYNGGKFALNRKDIENFIFISAPISLNILFFGFHLIMEINERYIASPFALTLVLCTATNAIFLPKTPKFSSQHLVLFSH